MSFTKNYLDQQNEASVNTDAQYDAEYLEFLRDQDLERRMEEEVYVLNTTGIPVLFDNSDLRRQMEKQLEKR